MRYLKIVLAGITFAVLTDVFGIFVGVIKCISNGAEINKSELLSVAFGIGAREGIYIGIVVVILMLVGVPRSRPPR